MKWFLCYLFEKPSLKDLHWSKMPTYFSKIKNKNHILLYLQRLQRHMPFVYNLIYLENRKKVIDSRLVLFIMINSATEWMLKFNCVDVADLYSFLSLPSRLSRFGKNGLVGISWEGIGGTQWWPNTDFCCGTQVRQITLTNSQDWR